MMKRAFLILLFSVFVLPGIWAGGEQEREKTNVLEIYHWWTSGSEKAAMEALIEVYVGNNPGSMVLQSPVSGGGGASMRQIMHSLILGGEAPDSFQSYPFGLVPYWEADMLEIIDDVWTDEVRAAVPDVVKNMCKMPDGHFYAVPAGVQQAGVVFYNKALFDRYNFEEPETMENLWDICNTLKSNGENAIALGDKNSWPLTYIFRSLIAAQGIEYYEAFINGEINSADNENLVASLQQLTRMMDYVNSDHAALTWDEAMGMVAKGEAAMSVMGDCGAGEFIAAEKEYGKNFGAFYLPGAQNIFGISLDVFCLPKGAKHPDNAKKWLETVISAEAQSAFAGPKGFIPARLDASMGTGFSSYQKNESFVHFKEAEYYRPGMWSGTPPTFMGALTDIIADRIGVNGDPKGAARQIVDLVKSTDWPTNWALTK
ncbi:ABC transporter substrate-binding protein [Marispirochaeta sp.]|uniref:ABC transporter substrate-binding protein n=1 Tax=Marispirochaeta sp. TaxID=2038653 RepID=UPI0029C61EC6|nr:ABC transporter substrate-binding protein [Marispirochaeta sp.]